MSNYETKEKEISILPDVQPINLTKVINATDKFAKSVPVLRKRVAPQPAKTEESK